MLPGHLTSLLYCPDSLADVCAELEMHALRLLNAMPGVELTLANSLGSSVLKACLPSSHQEILPDHEQSKS